MMKKEGERQGSAWEKKEKGKARHQQQQQQHRTHSSSNLSTANERPLPVKSTTGLDTLSQLFVHPKSTQELHSRSTNQVEY